MVLALTLLVAGVFLVDHIKFALAADDFAIDTALLDGCPDFHGLPVYARCSVLPQVVNYIDYLYLKMILPLDKS